MVITKLFYKKSARRWCYDLNEVEIQLHAGDCVCANIPESNSIFCTTRSWQNVYIEYDWIERAWYIVRREGTPILEELNGLEIRTV